MSDILDADQRSADFVIPDEVRVTLKKPLKLRAADGVVLEELAFRPPTVGEMKQITKRRRDVNTEAATILMLSLLSKDKLTPVDVEGMNLIDCQLCQEALEPFLALKERSTKKAD